VQQLWDYERLRVGKGRGHQKTLRTSASLQFSFLRSGGLFWTGNNPNAAVGDPQ